METKQELLFSIENFNSEAGQGMSGYGFSIVLAKPIVASLLQTKRCRDNKLEKMILDRIRNTFGYEIPEYSIQAPDYYRDSWLITYIKTLGMNCACFGISGDMRTRLEKEPISIRYTSHNIDTLQMASSILSAWLLWFNFVITQTEFDLPHASYS